MTLAKAGGVAALVEALLYVIGFAVLLTALNPGDTSAWSQADKLAFTLQHKAWFQAWTVLIYVIFGAVLVVLAVALHARLEPLAASWMRVATAFGLIWAGLVIASGMITSVGLDAVSGLHATDPAQATTLWLAVGTVQDGLGGGVEVVGGVWVGLISAAALRGKAFAAPLSWLGVAVGVAGVATLIPGLSGLGAVFGLGQIVWFAWLGVRLLRDSA